MAESRKHVKQQRVQILCTIRANLIVNDNTRVCSDHFEGPFTDTSIHTVFPTELLNHHPRSGDHLYITKLKIKKMFLQTPVSINWDDFNHFPQESFYEDLHVEKTKEATTNTDQKVYVDASCLLENLHRR